MGNCGLALLRLTGSLKGDCPNQVVALLGVVVWNRLTEFGDGRTGVSDLRHPSRGPRRKTPGRIAERGIKRCRVAQQNKRKQKQ